MHAKIIAGAIVGLVALVMLMLDANSDITSFSLRPRTANAHTDPPDAHQAPPPENATVSEK